MEPTAGERFEVDWAHFDKLDYSGDKRKIYALCMVECHIRLFYVEFTHSLSLETFLHCHIDVFRFFGGVVRECFCDNLLTAIAERDGSLIRFDPRLLAFAEFYLSRRAPATCDWLGQGQSRTGYRLSASKLLAAALVSRS
ncbi:MAG: hypothetical protein IT282_06590 [Bacteroidetes bacterium]|nr:hypothetical protein [Bacteroidota bacterium]